MILRDYQQRTVDAISTALNRGVKRPCASVATGGGKSAIIATLAKRYADKGHAVIVATHVQELIEQLDQTMRRCDMQPSVYASALKRREKEGVVRIQQVQSVWKKATEMPPASVIILDECHLLSSDDDTMYGQWLADHERMNPKLRIIGLSATPFRMREGLIYGPGQMFDECVIHIGMAELIKGGWLTPIVGKNQDENLDLSGLHVRAGEFIASEAEALMADDIKVAFAVRDMLTNAQGRQRGLVFTTSIKHSAKVMATLATVGETAVTVDGKMAKGERDAALAAHRDGHVRWLINCAVLTTGYDDPQIDVIAMLRPTRSAGLLLQIAGRGLRKAEGKANCLFLDYGKNIEYWGPLDQIEQRVRAAGNVKAAGEAPTRTCPECHTVMFAGCLKCPTCGKEFTRSLKHDEKASTLAVMSASTKRINVIDWLLVVHPGQDGKADTLRIRYLGGFPATEIASEWLSLSRDSNGWARIRAINALQEIRKKPDPTHEFCLVTDSILGGEVGDPPRELETIEQLIPVLRGALLRPKSISIQPDGKYQRVVAKHYD